MFKVGSKARGISLKILPLKPLSKEEIIAGAKEPSQVGQKFHFTTPSNAIERHQQHDWISKSSSRKKVNANEQHVKFFGCSASVLIREVIHWKQIGGMVRRAGSRVLVSYPHMTLPTKG